MIRAGRVLATLILLGTTAATAAQADQQWITFEGGEGPGKGKHIVLVSGDEEYRSEEALPQLAKILSKRHGFKTTVLFAIDPKTGEIKPGQADNIPGLEALQSADLMIIATRFRSLPPEQMKHIDDYLASGRPIIGMRTATHAFNFKDADSPYQHYSWRSEEKGWEGGFGRRILGETWIGHHGRHGGESTRGIVVDEMEDHPITNGIEDGEIWGPTDVYEVRLPLPSDCQPVILGQVLKGMKPSDEPVEKKKNDPMMPVAWIKTYQGENGQTGRVFTTTMGAATDLANEALRRLLVNASYWALGMEEQIPEKANVETVGQYKPTPFGFGGYQKHRKPADYANIDG